MIIGWHDERFSGDRMANGEKVYECLLGDSGVSIEIPYVCEDKEHTFEPRFKICINGARQVRPQCVRCGVVDGDSMAAPPGIVRPIDDVLEARFWSRYNRIGDIYKWLWGLKLQDRSARFWAKHYRVMRSRKWKGLRWQVYLRQGRSCKECKTPLGRKGWQCHHLHYNTLGYESSEDVVVLCKACHGKQHETPLPDRITEPYDVDSIYYSAQPLLLRSEREDTEGDN